MGQEYLMMKKDNLYIIMIQGRVSLILDKDPQMLPKAKQVLKVIIKEVFSHLSFNHQLVKEKRQWSNH